MNKHLGKDGFGLVETIVSFAILGIGIVSLLTLYNVVIIGNRQSVDLLKQSTIVNSAVDEVKKEIKVKEILSRNEIEMIIENVERHYPNIKMNLSTIVEVDNLYEIQLICKGYLNHEKYFYARVYGGNTE